MSEIKTSLGGKDRSTKTHREESKTHKTLKARKDEVLKSFRYVRPKTVRSSIVEEDPKDATMRHYQEEILRLKTELERKKSTPDPSELEGISSDPNASESSGSNSKSSADMQRYRELAALIKPYGIDPNSEPSVIKEQLAEKRKELLQDNLTIKASKDKLLEKLDEAENLAQFAELECSKLTERIGWLESKVSELTGGKDLVLHSIEQQMHLKEKQQELSQQIQRYEVMRKKFQEEELSIEDLKEKGDNVEAHGRALSRKIGKATRRQQSITEKLKQVHMEHGKNMREVETILMDLRKEFSLKRMIIDNFVPRASRKLLEQRMVWDDDKKYYKLIDPVDTTNFVQQRCAIDRSTKLPMYSISERGIVHMVDSVHFTNENLLQLNPEVPKRRTKDYAPPSTDPYVASLIKKAIKDVEKNFFIDCNYTTKKRAVRQVASVETDYIRIGDAVIRQVKQLKSAVRASGQAGAGEQQTIQYQDFAVVSSHRSAKIDAGELARLLLNPTSIAGNSNGRTYV